MVAPNVQSTANVQVLTGAFDLTSNLPAIQTPLGTLVGLPVVLANNSIPISNAPTGTITANGALVSGTALPQIYGPTGVSPGIWLNFPAGAVKAGSAAGFYWVIMTSVTAGTVYNNTLTVPGSKRPPALIIPVVDAGPGSYVGISSAQTLDSITVPANSMGLSGAMWLFIRWSFPTSGSTKTINGSFGGTSYVAPSRTTSITDQWCFLLSNRGSATQQIVQSVPIPATAGASAFVNMSINTAVDQNLTFLGTNVAAEFVVLESTFVLLMPGS
jgi:hypothetical protein